MSEPPEGRAAPPKPRLKININRSSSSLVGEAASAVPASAVAASAVTPGGHRKVKLKLSSSQPPTPADQTPVTTKAGRQPKPTQKLVESKKRPHDDDLDDLRAASSATSSHQPTKIKILKTPKSASTTHVVFKTRGRIPVHPPGEGYDSEASEREEDPAIEEQFILRMLPGEHCDYLRTCLETGKIGIPKSKGGADIALKFFEEETRRAIVTVKGQLFAAVMVDLPTITESMKTWDKKSFMKSADICQMLLIFDKVKSEEEARHIPLPSMINSHFKWPHGLTPPMHDCVNRRFAKTISRKEIEDKEAEVERLLAEDAKAASTKWEWVDDRRQDDDDEDMVDEDIEGEVDDSMGYFAGHDALFGDNDNDLEADLEAAFADDTELVAETPATGMDMTTPLATQVNTPAAGLQESIEMDDESEEDDDDDDDDDDDLDEDERAQRDEEQGVKDIIHELEKQLAKSRADLDKTQNKILRDRIDKQIKQLKSEIDLKKSSIGMEVDD
ncbi:hypothetical protein S7711_00853 [Stachybotrys chartarum IBT 7711]|uniref:TAFII55 protein conserved region domain-containing protein n=1 Tax=Stachybotrys chartarum (strain CBS 109288 / IBT 7711) TaxID=1280523 RepID=A0A084B0F0_STACB|nr:hypothetical protein S7711_00853 [Stachybotrys chartarum IBT 7711]KFA46994.1 hypothetical protein S40293_08982 [Stachybotrys chartarum IBT 40293]KFA78196.1 hypothetical protein S40288_01407 [Stachybotrys chartarum IBT 40288]